MRGDILKTNDYDMFNKFTYNRKVNKFRVYELVESMKKKNKQKYKTILVDKDFNIIDGQHRLEACKILGCPVYYQVDEDYSPDDIILLNKNQNNWKIEDYIEYYSKHGNENYKKLIDLKEMYEVNFSLILIWSSNFSRSEIIKNIKSGSYQHMNEEKIINGLKFFLRIKEIILKKTVKSTTLLKQNTFHNALKNVYNNQFFDNERFLERFESCPIEITLSSSVHDYVERFMRIYNFKKQKGNLSIIKSKKNITVAEI